MTSSFVLHSARTTKTRKTASEHSGLPCVGGQQDKNEYQGVLQYVLGFGISVQVRYGPAQSGPTLFGPAQSGPAQSAL
jgi:hypothetical protein